MMNLLLSSNFSDLGWRHKIIFLLLRTHADKCSIKPWGGHPSKKGLKVVFSSCQRCDIDFRALFQPSRTTDKSAMICVSISSNWMWKTMVHEVHYSKCQYISNHFQPFGAWFILMLQVQAVFYFITNPAMIECNKIQMSLKKILTLFLFKMIHLCRGDMTGRKNKDGDKEWKGNPKGWMWQKLNKEK